MNAHKHIAQNPLFGTKIIALNPFNARAERKHEKILELIINLPFEDSEVISANQNGFELKINYKVSQSEYVESDWQVDARGEVFKTSAYKEEINVPFSETFFISWNESVKSASKRIENFLNT